ncbi:hypothetical protein D5086_026828 [Populus alba]|uniref:Uncharacterized protein n=1 Tax=Populus alba TaxID=43335 RepID=A0ACC4B2Y5_POPAL
MAKRRLLSSCVTRSPSLFPAFRVKRFLYQPLRDAFLRPFVTAISGQVPYLETFAGRRTLIDCKVLVRKSEAAMQWLKHWQDLEVRLEMGIEIELVASGAVEGWDFGPSALDMEPDNNILAADEVVDAIAMAAGGKGWL